MRKKSDELMFGQITLFDPPEDALMATNLEIGDKYEVLELDTWMKRLVPKGKYVIKVDYHNCVLVPVGYSLSGIEIGHKFSHYTVDGRLFDSIFVGRGERDELEAS